MTTFRIPDMTCGHCASTIARAVATVAKDARLDFNIQEKLVRIFGDAADADLAEAIADAGYTVEAVPDSPATVPVQKRAGGGCCCGTRQSAPVDMRQTSGKNGSSCCG